MMSLDKCSIWDLGCSDNFINLKAYLK